VFPSSSFLVFLSLGCSSVSVRPSSRSSSGWVVCAVFPSSLFLLAVGFARSAAVLAGVAVPVRPGPAGGFLVSAPCSPAVRLAAPGRLVSVAARSLSAVGF
jgi:hypothetical protein